MFCYCLFFKTKISGRQLIHQYLPLSMEVKIDVLFQFSQTKTELKTLAGSLSVISFVCLPNRIRFWQTTTTTTTTTTMKVWNIASSIEEPLARIVVSAPHALVRSTNNVHNDHCYYFILVFIRFVFDDDEQCRVGWRADGKCIAV